MPRGCRRNPARVAARVPAVATGLLNMLKTRGAGVNATAAAAAAAGARAKEGGGFLGLPNTDAAGLVAEAHYRLDAAESVVAVGAAVWNAVDEGQP